MTSYNSSQDVAELRDDSFNTLLLIGISIATFVICVVLLVWVNANDFKVTMWTSGWKVGPLLVTSAATFLAYRVKYSGYMSLAKWIFIIGLIAGPTLSIGNQGPNTTAYLAYILPIVITSVIIGSVELRVTALVIALMFSATFYYQYLDQSLLTVFLESVERTWTYILLYGMIAMITYLSADILFTTVQWAIDSQRKDEKRTRLLQEHQEQLDRTILQLKVAHSQLQTLNDELGKAKGVAEEANRLKTQFLANMSHELRTPLNAIINFTRFIGKERYGPLTERQQDLQKRVLANADHLLGLINDILDLSKIEAGKMELFCEQVDLDPLLHGVMSTAVGLTRDKGLELKLDMQPGLPMVWIDKTRVRQVLLNLISNAAKFTQKGGITVRTIPTVDAMIQISVQDTGIGISSEHHNMVFEEFRQVQGELTREYQGTGLGLPISKKLIEMHGGRMWLESMPGAGSTFFFTVPLAEVSDAPVVVDEGPTPVAEPELVAIEPQAPAQLQEEHVLEATAALISGSTVVVIDDDVNSQQILRHYLQSSGYNVHSVTDSRQALDAIQDIHPDLVILDVMMPHTNGWEVLSQLKNTPETASVPVIMCSISENQRLGVALGASAYVVKPVREEEFIGLVSHWTGNAATILVVDDDADARHVIRSMLEGSGYRVVEAQNGARGLQAVHDMRPQMIILDLMMPEMDGFEMLERLRNDPANAGIPVVIVSAKDLDHREREWLLNRSQHFMQKGQMSVEQFIQYVHHLTGREVVYGH